MVWFEEEVRVGTEEQEERRKGLAYHVGRRILESGTETEGGWRV